MMKFPIVLFASIMLCLPVFAGDMRKDHIEFEQHLQDVIQKAEAEKQAAKDEEKALSQIIKSDKQALGKAIADLKFKLKDLNSRNKKLQADVDKLQAEETKLKEALAETSAVNREFEGLSRTNAKDLKAMFIQSLQSGLDPGRQEFLEPVILQEKFPTMDDVQQIVDHLFEEIKLSGQVKITTANIVDRKGKERQAELLVLGNFTGIYTLDNETGFLLYSDQSQRFFALSKLPSSMIRKNINSYLKGRSDEVFIDIAKGAAVRQLAHQLNLAEQVPKGGAIVWPILIILGFAVLIVIERIVFFARRRINVEELMSEIRKFIISEDWEGCRSYLNSKQDKLVPKVLLTALAMKDRTREEMENALQEAILGEIPAIERFISTLGMLAAIAPLLGLLGTVTGMINTFHVITYHGTGDPRMMSGGISEALVTTMLGLTVAIPIMLAHTFLSRRVETMISVMEEKSVAFVNMVFKSWAERH